MNKNVLIWTGVALAVTLAAAGGWYTLVGPDETTAKTSFRTKLRETRVDFDEPEWRSALRYQRDYHVFVYCRGRNGVRYKSSCLRMGPTWVSVSVFRDHDGSENAQIQQGKITVTGFSDPGERAIVEGLLLDLYAAFKTAT